MRQKFDGDCAVCCLAMWLRIPWEDAVKEFSPQKKARFKHGVSEAWMLKASEKLGLRLRRVSLKGANWRRKAIVCIDEDTHEHAVYWDPKNRRAMDPRTGTRVPNGLGAVRPTAVYQER